MPNVKPLEQAYRYCPNCGEKTASVGDVPFCCTACNFVNFFGPVTAVGAILLDSSDQVLLVRRARDPGKGMLGMPGGFVDRGERAEAALRREIQEEVGLDVESQDFLMTLPNQYTYKGFTAPVLDIFFTVRVPTFEAVHIDNKEVMGLWIGVPGEEQLDQMAFESNRLALQTYLS